MGGTPTVTFFGVRGSCPCPSTDNSRYGGNTACVLLDDGEQDPIVLDLGTGLRPLGESRPPGPFRAAALVTHIHWDHVQGLPFFPPVHRPGTRLDVYGPHQETGPLGAVFGELMRPPYFPIQYGELIGEVAFHDVTSDRFKLGNAEILVRPVPHVGPTVGYRIEWNGVSITYISDHQQPAGGGVVADGVLELCDGADLVIHDAQYTAAEFSQKADWGHCTVDYAVFVAKEAGAKRLALFHHDPAHDDASLDRILDGARCLGAMAGLDVVAAAEGMTLTPGGR
ncbi:MAG TPA: MBL fold metallo-hydrolase [Acidimicrobiales bacterium]|nr:MBL fold metallo-hydrolase [Acidimicrobiales bacterium]